MTMSPKMSFPIRYHTTKSGESPLGTHQNMATKKIVLCLRLCHSSESAIYLMADILYGRLINVDCLHVPHA